MFFFTFSSHFHIACLLLRAAALPKNGQPSALFFAFSLALHGARGMLCAAAATKKGQHSALFFSPGKDQFLGKGDGGETLADNERPVDENAGFGEAALAVEGRGDFGYHGTKGEKSPLDARRWRECFPRRRRGGGSAEAGGEPCGAGHGWVLGVGMGWVLW